MNDKLLDGFTVLDFTRVLAGPYCTRMLGDLGARVIKIERPGEGDEIRPIVHQIDPGRADQSSYFVRLNASKEGIAIDLSKPQARAVVLDLVAKADVVVENFSPGVMARYGLDANTLRTLHPNLVYCSISGFGQSGPLSSMQAYAHLINAISGMMDMERCGDTQPRASYLQAADVLAGTHAFGAICAALVRRGRKGAGATLDVSMFECLIAADDIAYTSILNDGPIFRRPRVGMVVHAIGDRHIAVQTAGAPHLWARLVTLIGKPELATDARFATPLLRRENWSELLDIYRDWLNRYRSVDEAVEALTQARIPSVPMLSPEEVMHHPHTAHRQTFPGVEHPARGSVQVTSTPFFVDGKPTHPSRRAPYLIGEHTREVLETLLGYSSEKIAALMATNVVHCPTPVKN